MPLERLGNRPESAESTGLEDGICGKLGVNNRLYSNTNTHYHHISVRSLVFCDDRDPDSSLTYFVSEVAWCCPRVCEWDRTNFRLCTQESADERERDVDHLQDLQDCPFVHDDLYKNELMRAHNFVLRRVHV